MADSVLPPMSERELQDQTIHLAGLTGWLRVHFRPARTLKGWATAQQGDDGFLDTVLAHEQRQRLIFMELKSSKGKLTPEQQRWINVLRACGQEVYVFRPEHWPLIEAILTGRDEE